MATERNVPAPTPLALEQERASRRNLPTVCPEINFSRALFALKMGRGTERGLWEQGTASVTISKRRF